MKKLILKLFFKEDELWLFSTALISHKGYLEDLSINSQLQPKELYQSDIKTLNKFINYFNPN